MNRILQLAMPLAVLLALIVGVEHADPDLWGRLAVAAVLAQTGEFPQVEDFSFTAAGVQWIDHEWLTGVVYYGVLSTLGEHGLVLFKYLLMAAALALTLATAVLPFRAAAGATNQVDARERDAALALCALLLTLCAPVLAPGFLTTARAQLFSFVGFALTGWMLELHRRGLVANRGLLGLVLLSVPWGNAHGGFVMGVLAVGLYAASAALRALLGESWREASWLAATALGMIAAVVFVNPYGPLYGEFLLHAWTLDRSAITEWLPLFETGNAWAITVWLAAAVLGLAAGGVALVAALGRWRAGDASARDAERISALAPALVLLLLVSMTFLSQRIQTFLALWLAALVPWLVPGAVRFLAARARAWQWVPALVVTSLSCLVVAAFAARAPLLEAVVPQINSPHAVTAVYPAGAVRYLRNSPYRGRLLNAFNGGEFLLWTLYPKFRVAMDGRYEEVYTQQQFHEVRDFFDFALGDGPEMLAYLARSRADVILFDVRWQSYHIMKQLSDDWVPVYNDGQFAIVAARAQVAAHGRFKVVGKVAERVTLGDYFSERDRRRFGHYPSGAAPSRARELPPGA